MNRLDALLEKRAKGDKRSAQQRLIAQGRKSRLKGPPGEEHKAARGVKKVRGSKETEGGRADTKTRAMMHKSAHPVLRAIAHKLGQGGEHGSAALRGKTEPEKGGGAHKGYKMVFGKWQKVEMMNRSTLDKLTEIREALETTLDEEEKMVFGVKREVGGLPRRKFGSGKFKRKLKPTPGSPQAGSSTTAEKRKFIAQKKTMEREKAHRDRMKKLRGGKKRPSVGSKAAKWKKRFGQE